MSRQVSFFVTGYPKGQPRARSRRFGKGVYDPGTADNWKSCVRNDWKAQEQAPFTGPVAVDLLFQMPRPKSHYKTGKNAGTIKDNVAFWFTGTPDCDNLAKAVLDALTDAGAWVDDASVCQLFVSKTYDAETGCHIDIRQLNP